MIPQAISRAVQIDAPPERVWAIVTEARHLAGWFSDEVELDPRPGGAMTLTWRGHGVSRGVVEVVEPPSRFVFRWMRLPDADGWTRVEFVLTAEGGGTSLRVTESGFRDLPWPPDVASTYADDNATGWNHELRQLLDYLDHLP